MYFFKSWSRGTPSDKDQQINKFGDPKEVWLPFSPVNPCKSSNKSFKRDWSSNQALFSTIKKYIRLYNKYIDPNVCKCLYTHGKQTQNDNKVPFVLKTKPPPSQPNQIKLCIGIPLHQNLPHSCFRKLGGAVLHLNSGVGLAETALQSGRRSGGWYARSDTRSAFPVERRTIDGGCFHQSAIDLPALG